MKILKYLSLFIVLSITIISCTSKRTQRNNNTNTGNNSRSSNCTKSTIISNPNYSVNLVDVPLETIDFTFKNSNLPFNDCCIKRAYTPRNQSTPGYNIKNSWGFFTLFGDGNYSWANNPNHVYKESGTYDHFNVEYTKIKNTGGKPPSAWVDPVFESNLEICFHNDTSTTNEHDEIKNGQIGFNQSRPMFCDYTFIQIIKIDANTPFNSKINIEYNSTDLDLIQIIPYHKMSYSIPSPASTSNTAGSTYDTKIDLILTPTIGVNGEIPIFLQFKSKCGNNCVNGICSGSLNVNIIKPNNSVSSKNLEFSAQKNNPFDPNWLDIDHEVCYSNDYQIHRMTGWFYHYDTDTSKRNVVLTIRELTNKLHRITGNNLSIGLYPKLQSYNNRRSLQYNSIPTYPLNAPSYPLHGVGDQDLNGHPLSREKVLKSVTFDIIIKPGATGFLDLEFTSKFEGVDEAITTYRLDITDCENPNLNYFYDINSENHGDIEVNPNVTPIITPSGGSVIVPSVDIEIDQNIQILPVDSL
ncbi:MAG: hypothetical protein ACI8XB_001971 [Patiriisocius sp.]|jgi:hypothetical protein